MKKSFLILSLLTLAFIGIASAEDAAVPAETAPAAAPSGSAAPAEVPAAEPAPVVEAPDMAAEPQDSTLVDNLEFISGEVAELDEAGKTVSVRLYGDNEEAASDKVLKVSVDENTDITDGEQDRDLKSLTAGTEVDVEYDPATNKSTYIFVY